MFAHYSDGGASVGAYAGESGMAFNIFFSQLKKLPARQRPGKTRLFLQEIKHPCLLISCKVFTEEKFKYNQSVRIVKA